ncbi:hypothetical protein EJB05_44354, partial [Eragrostis curvula]
FLRIVSIVLPSREPPPSSASNRGLGKSCVARGSREGRSVSGWSCAAAVLQSRVSGIPRAAAVLCLGKSCVARGSREGRSGSGRSCAAAVLQSRVSGIPRAAAVLCLGKSCVARGSRTGRSGSGRSCAAAVLQSRVRAVEETAPGMEGKISASFRSLAPGMERHFHHLIAPGMEGKNMSDLWYCGRVGNSDL